MTVGLGPTPAGPSPTGPSPAGAIPAGESGRSARPPVTARGRPTRWSRRRADVPRLVALRLALIIPMMLALSAGVFALAAASPFNPLAAYLGDRYERASADQKAAMAQQLGLDAPWWQAWWTWLSDAVTGDFGYSRIFNAPVTTVFADRLPWTMLLSGVALALAVVVALVAGAYAGLRPGSWADRVLSAVAVVIQAIPPFVAAMTAVALFAVTLLWLPAAGATSPGQDYTLGGVVRHLLLPASVLALTQVPWLLLAVRTSVAAAVESDAVRGATARGSSRRTIVVKHILPVSLAPMATIVAARLPELIVGAVLVEEVFGWPGLASAVVSSAKALDFPLLAALTLATTAVVLLGSLLADVFYLFADPRVSADV